MIIDKVFFSYNSQALQKEYADYDVTGAINFENIVDMQLRVGFFSADDRERTPEFMVATSTELYTELGVRRLAEAEVVLSSELNLEEYLVFLERQERKVKGVAEKPIVLVDREDFEDLRQKYLIDKVHLRTAEPEPEADEARKQEREFEQQAQIISEFVGLEYAKVLKMVRTVDSDFSLTSKLNALIKEEQKKLEAERKKKQEEEEEAKRREKNQQEGLFDVGEEEEKKADDTQEAQELLDVQELKKLKKEQMTPEELRRKQEKQQQKERDEMISQVLDLVQEDVATAMKFELKERKKLEQQTAEALFKSVKGFTEASAYGEYRQSLDLLFTLYARRILQKILTIKFEESLATMLNSQERKQQFTKFLKIVSNEAIFVNFNTRNKKLVRNIDELMRRIVVKCKADPDHKPFIDELFREDVLQASKDLIKHLRGEKLRSVRVQFSSEEKATKYSNPYFVLSVSKIFLEHCPDDLLREDVLQTLIEQFLTLAYMFNKDPQLKVKINEFILNILEAVQKNYSKLSFKLKEQLQQMWMFKSIVEKYTYNATSTEQVYLRHHLLLLEILMKLLHLKKLSKKEVHSIYTKNETIL